MTKCRSYRQLINKLKGRNLSAVLISGAGISFLVRIGGTGIVFLSELFLAQVMGKNYYGIYTYVFSWLNVLLLLSKMGFDSLLVKCVAIYQAQKEWGKLRGLLKISHIFVFFSGIFIATVTLIIFKVITLRASVSAELVTTFWLACLVLPLLTIVQIQRATFQGLKNIVLTEFPIYIFQPILLIIFIISAQKIFEKSIDSKTVMGLQFIAVVVVFLFNSFYLRRFLPLEIKNEANQFLYKEWIESSFYFLFLSGMYVILNQTDKIMIGGMIGTTESGIYSVASRATMLITLGLTAVNMIFAPMISELYANGKIVELQNIATIAARGIFAYSISVGCAFILLGDRILGLFGSGFTEGYSVLLILTVGSLVNALAGSVNLLMMMTGHQKQVSTVVASSALLNIILNAALIPVFDINGAAIATTTTMAIWNIILLIYVRKYLNINPTII